MTIRILPEAAADLECATDFYEAQSPGLGRYFNDGIMADIESLRLYAGIHQREFGLFRLLSRRFPFAIYYAVDAEEIAVYAVLDCRQDPVNIENRLG